MAVPLASLATQSAARLQITLGTSWPNVCSSFHCIGRTLSWPSLTISVQVSTDTDTQGESYMAEHVKDTLEVTLTARRSRRANAGNRLLAMCAEEVAKAVPDPEDVDVDFQLKEQNDEYDEAFASTDEDADMDEAALQGNAAEAMIAKKDRAAQKEVRERRERANRTAVARQRVTFDPAVHAAALEKVELGALVEGAGRHDLAGGMASRIDQGKRKSSRTATLSSTEDVRNKLKEANKQRAAQKRRGKAPTKEMTQDEYIRRALEREEGNVLELRNFLSTEEEKRRRAKGTRPTVQGPMLRWVSRVEERPVPEIIVLDDDDDEIQVTRSGSLENISTLLWPTFQQISTIKARDPSGGDTGPGSLTLEHMEVDTTSHVQQPTLRIARNYLVHALDQGEDARKPRWRETMRALFGDHVNWADLLAYAGDKRPTERPKEICPITGKLARYRDPRTGVAFADMHVYGTLTRLLEHQYTWSDTLGCYVDRTGANT